MAKTEEDKKTELNREFVLQRDVSQTYKTLSEKALTLANLLGEASILSVGYYYNNELGEVDPYDGDYMQELGKLKYIQEVAEKLARDAFQISKVFKEKV